MSNLSVDGISFSGVKEIAKYFNINMTTFDKDRELGLSWKEIFLKEIEYVETSDMTDLSREEIIKLIELNNTLDEIKILFFQKEKKEPARYGYVHHFN